MKVIAIFVVFSVALVTAGPVQDSKERFDNYNVYRFTPKREAEVKFLSELETDYPGKIIYWTDAGSVGMPVDIMIPPNLQAEILGKLEIVGLSVDQPFIRNVQKLIDEQEATNAAVIAHSPKLSWDAYYDYQAIQEWLDEQVAVHPNISSVETYGQSFEGRNLKVIKISTGGNGQRPVIFIDANIHAREWITNAVATYIINELLNGNENSTLKGWLDTFDFHVVPVINVDGNYGFMWNSGGSSSVCSSDTFHGVSAFSEPETKTLSDYISRIGSRVKAYLSLHSYTQLLLIPYGTRVNGSVFLPDHDNHMRIGELVRSAISQRYGTQFRLGNWYDILYESSGTSMDWAKGVHNTTLAYTFELRDLGEHGFLLPPEQIVPSGLEIIDGLVVICDQLQRQLNAEK